MNVNKVFIAGRLTRDPALKYMANQTPVCEFGVCSNRRWKSAGGEEKEEATFVDVTVFGKTAEVVNQHFTKGKEIFIEGRLNYSSWEDKQGGGKRSKLTIIMDNFQFVGGRDSGGDSEREGVAGRIGGGQNQTQYPKNRSTVGQRPPAEDPFSSNQEFKEDEIPFAWSGRISQPI